MMIREHDDNRPIPIDCDFFVFDCFEKAVITVISRRPLYLQLCKQCAIDHLTKLDRDGILYTLSIFQGFVKSE